MDCFDTFLAYANMQIIFFTKLLIQNFQKNISEIHENVKLCLQFPYVPELVNL